MRVRKVIGAAAVVAVAGLTVAGATGTASAAPEGKGAAEHGLGFDLSAFGQMSAQSADAGTAQPVRLRAGAAPASYDLTQYALSPGNQGKVGSCVTWATGYTGYGILMHEQGISGSPMAPMFIYSQIAQGNDQGTTAARALPMERDQGIDTKAHYTQGDFDYTTQPTQAERDNAAHYKLSGFTKLPVSGQSAVDAIKNAISQGQPVPYGFRARESFRSLSGTAASNYSYLPSKSDPEIGGHEVTIIAYNDKGVKVENSWGTSWGDGGFFTLPWSYFNTGDVIEMHAMGKLVANQ